MDVKSFADLAAEPDTEQVSLLGDGLLIPGGRLVIYGAPGDFKSFAVAQLLYCISEGINWLNHEVHHKVPTLYIELEIPNVKFKDRVRGLNSHFGRTGQDCHLNVSYDWALDSQKAQRELATAVLEVGANVVALDPLYLIMSGSENDDKAVKELMRLYNGIIGATGAAGILVHHANKGIWSEGKKVDRGAIDMGGSRLIWAWCDTLLRVQRVSQPRTVEMRWEKTRHGEPPPAQWVQLTDLVLEISEGDPVTSVLRLLGAGPTPLKTIDTHLKEYSDMGPQRATELRKRMVGEGQIVELRDPSNSRAKLYELVEGAQG